MSKKFSYEEVKCYLELENYFLPPCEYKDNRTKIKTICPNNHIYVTTFGNFKSGNRCSECVGLKKKSVEEVAFYFKSHGYTLLDKEYINSKERLHTICPKGHDYFATYSTFKKGTRCLECSGRKRKTIDEIRFFFKKEGYTLVSDKYENNQLLLHTKCPENHDYYVRYGDFQQGYRCSQCAGLKKKTIEEVRSVFEKENYELVSTKFDNIASKLHIKCSNKHDYYITYNNFQQGVRCPICSNIGISYPEKEIFEFVKTFYPSVLENTYKIIPPLELDIYIPELRLAIEYTGLYWHSEEYKDKNYHYDKMKICNEKGIRLITIFEDEWLDRKDQVKNFLLSVLNKNSLKLMARKTELKEVSKQIAIEFLNQNHIQGAPLMSIAYGLYANNELQAVITGNKHHRQGFDDTFVLNRLAFKSGVSISGGSSKLLKTLIGCTKEQGYSRLISWSDNRWSEGNVYEKLGFQLTESSSPDYSYVQKQRRISKQSCQKKSLLKKGGIGTTEREMALSLGLYRIWDCGKKRWEINL